MPFGKNGRSPQMAVGANGKLSVRQPETLPSPTSSLSGEIRMAGRKYLSSGVTETFGRFGRWRQTAAGASGENWVRRPLGSGVLIASPWEVIKISARNYS